MILSVAFFIVERIIGRNRSRPILRRGWLTDVCFWFFTPLVTKVLTRAAFFLPVVILVWLGLASVEDIKSNAYKGFGPLANQPTWLEIIEIYFFFDLVGYWSHRLFHRGRWWPFHAVHHSSEDLDWLSSVRVHPVNDLVSKMCQVTPFLLLGFKPIAVVSAAPFFTLYAIFIHANVDWDFGPLRYVIATPVFHRWHHSKDREAWDKNFAGLFAFLDILFGTFYMPKDRKPENFGIPEEFPKDFVGQLVHPFARAFGKRQEESEKPLQNTV
ncbi:MAG TPA: sterol desaturase family protein [Pirellulales bacterium]|nr:sterol desaturase family protein [Pirellulales bacterium]